MMRGQQKLGAIAIIAGGLLALTGCSPEPKANEAELTIADVQGVSFNDPLPVDAQSTQTADTAATIDAPANIALAAAPTTAPATAESMPADIAAIPSATPMPSPTPDPVVDKPTDIAQANATIAAAEGEYVPITFKKLSGFKYVEPIPGQGQETVDAEAKDQIPAEIKALDGTNAIVEGWMVPMDVAEDGSVKSFVLVKTQPQCCFGDMQAMNEWVDVSMLPGKNAEFNVDMPMKVYGQLEVGEKKEDGFVLSVYRMKAAKVEL